MDISAKEKGRVERSWHLSLGEGIVATSGDSATFVLRRDEVAQSVVILDGLFLRRTVSFKKPVGKVLRLDPQSFQTFTDWLGYQPTLALSLKQRYAWLIAIGVLFVLSSLPLAGDPQKGIAPIPFHPLDMGLGLSLVLIGVLSRRRPHRIYFLLDSAWFLILAISTSHNIVAGSSPFWLVVVLLQLSLVASGYLSWQRFAAFARRQPGAGPVS
jgi:hypothetical protein